MPTWKARMLRWNLVPGRLTALFLAIAVIDLVAGLIAPYGWAGVADTIGAVLFGVSAFFNARTNYYRLRVKHWRNLTNQIYARMLQRWRDEQGL